LADISTGMGLAYIGAALPIALGAVGTGIAQSGIGAAGMGLLAEKEGSEGKVLLFVAIPETMVILGFVFSFLIMSAISAAAAGGAAGVH